MREVVAALYGISGALPTAALAWVWLGSRQRLRRLQREHDAVTSADREDRSGPVIVDGRPVRQLTWGELPGLLVHDELVRVQDTLRDLRGPALLTGVGVIVGTVASVWSLYLG